MMEQILNYPVHNVYVVLLFLLVLFLLVLYAGRIRSFWQKKSRLSHKVPGKTIIVIFFLWVGILLLRKVTYYIPIPGIIQSKDTLWWAAQGVVFPLYGIFWIIVALLLSLNAESLKQGGLELANAVGAIIVGVVLFLAIFFPAFMDAFFQWVGLSYEDSAGVILTMPLLVLKMICSGKYLGLFTSLLLACFIFYAFKNRKKIPGKIKMLIAALLVIGIGTAGYFIFTGDWQEKFQHRAQTVKSQRDIEDLLEAAYSIQNNANRSDALRSTALTIAGKGNTQWAISVAQSIPDEKIKNNTLSAFQEKEEKND